MACMFLVHITTPPRSTHYLTYTPLYQGVCTQATVHQRENSFPVQGLYGGENTGGEKCTNSSSAPPWRGMGPLLWAQAPVTRPRRCTTAAVWSQGRDGGRMAAMAGVVLCGSTPHRRRGGGGGSLRSVCGVALNPWRRCPHLKSALGTPLKCPPPPRARPRWRAKVKFVTCTPLKTPGMKGFPSRKKCQNGGWAGLAA